MLDANVIDKDSVLWEIGEIIHPKDTHDDWWRSSVIYQIYPKSFRDSTGDGIGDLKGIILGLPALKELGVDAIWISPFYPSPQKDGGYDVADYCAVDPMFGTMEDFDAMVDEAQRLDIKVIVDMVPNHCSSDHPLFQKALLSEPDSPERDMFIFRDGKGPGGRIPPNNWRSHFGGPAWTRVTTPAGQPGQWYLHLFDTSQPDFNWRNRAVHEEFIRILRFWLDHGVSGFRVDVAHALVKSESMSNWEGRSNGRSMEGYPGVDAPMFGQPEVHEIFREWRKVINEYGHDKILCAEANVDPVERITDWVRSDEMHQAFNFAYLYAKWDPQELKEVITESFEAFDKVGAPTTWVLSNHDKMRHATRFGQEHDHGRGSDGLGPDDIQPNTKLGLARAQASSLFMMGMPGGIYLYQGEELGLHDNTMIPPTYRQDPTFLRTEGTRMGRDGSRVPLPWTRNGFSYGFNDSGASWLPQPPEWPDLSRQAQETEADSTLTMYRKALALRKERELGSGSFAWVDTQQEGILAYMNGSTMVIMNMTDQRISIPVFYPVLHQSSPDATYAGTLSPNSSVWLEKKVYNAS